jgi:hypothetical protein
MIRGAPGLFPVREIRPPDTQAAFPVIAEAYGVSADDPKRGLEQFVDRVDRELRPDGYRVAGTFPPRSVTATGVAGFRLVRSNALGDHLWVDDFLATGPGPEAEFTQLLIFLDREARKLGVLQIHVEVPLKAEMVSTNGLQEAYRLGTLSSTNPLFHRDRAIAQGLQEVGSRFVLEVDAKDTHRGFPS